MRCWSFHVPVPPEHARIDYPDVRMDQGAFDYGALLAHWETAARKHGAEPYIFDGRDDIDPTAPMYERVRVMVDYIEGRDPFMRPFDQPTIFLDSDAFLNADIRHIFDGDWDIGVTYRDGFPGMELNEGCILANNRRPDAVRSFFREYLATYDRLCADPNVIAKYKNIQRWRGGQLSLNRLANPMGRPSALDRLEIVGATVIYLPCWKYNFPVDRVVPAELDQKAVLHLKGQRKHLLDQIIAYQEGHHAAI
jgi:hypothetical protein